MKPALPHPVAVWLCTALLCAAGFLSACSKQQEPAAKPDEIATAYSISEKDKRLITELFPNSVESATGLRHIVTQAGQGTATPKSGTIVKVNYELRLLGGPVIESSQKALGGPLVVPIGVGRVIRGWEEAVMEMKLGENAPLIVPHYLGYGVTGSPPKIPPYATLVFDLELVGF